MKFAKLAAVAGLSLAGVVMSVSTAFASPSGFGVFPGAPDHGTCPSSHPGDMKDGWGGGQNGNCDPSCTKGPQALWLTSGARGGNCQPCLPAWTDPGKNPCPPRHDPCPPKGHGNPGNGKGGQRPCGNSGHRR